MCWQLKRMLKTFELYENKKISYMLYVHTESDIDHTKMKGKQQKYIS